MRLSRTGILLLCVIFFTVCANAQTELRWSKDVTAARKAATKSQKPVLLFFDMPEAKLAIHMNSLFEKPQVRSLLASSLECVKIDFQSERELATNSGVLRGGQVVIQEASGKTLEKISEPVSVEEFISSVSKHIPRSGTASTSSKILEEHKGLSKVTWKKGKLVAGPVSLSSTKADIVDIASLQKGRNYIIVVEGDVTVWGQTQPDYRVDGMFKFNPKKNIPEAKIESIRLLNPEIRFAELVSVTHPTEVTYNPAHRYEAPLIGQGKMLQAFFADWDYGNNSGTYKISVYEGL